MDKSFFKEYPLNIDYSFNLNYEVRFRGMDQKKLDPNTQITIDTKYGEVTLSIRDFSLLTHYEVDLPPSFYEKISFIPTSSKFLKLISGYKIVFKERISYGCPEGYFRVPGYNNYAISLAGDVVNIYTGNSLKPFFLYGYPTVNVKSPTCLTFSQLKIHVAVAKTFIENPDNKDLVNHIDGNKSNHSINNLEWVTASENVNHAIRSGLFKINKPCMIRDIENDEIHYFESIADAGQFVGYGSGLPYTVRYVQGKKRPLLFRRRFEFKFLDDKTPWFFNKEKKLKVDSKGPFEIRNVESGVVKRFNLLKEIAEFLIVHVSRVYTANLTDGKRTLKGYQIRPVSDEDWPIHREPVSNEAIHYTIFDIESHEMIEFTSSVKAAKFLSTDRATLKRRAEDGKIHNGKYLVFIGKKEEIGPVQTELRLFENDGNTLKPITLS